MGEGCLGVYRDGDDINIGNIARWYLGAADGVLGVVIGCWLCWFTFAGEGNSVVESFPRVMGWMGG